jgi:hypothetical protein
VSFQPNPSGVTAGLPSLSPATKPPCRCVITRTSFSSGVRRVSTGIHDGYVFGRRFLKLICTGVPVRATTAMPNDPAWPVSPEPSS